MARSGMGILSIYFGQFDMCHYCIVKVDTTQHLVPVSSGLLKIVLLHCSLSNWDVAVACLHRAVYMLSRFCGQASYTHGPPGHV